jgi:hypothetical protein
LAWTLTGLKARFFIVTGSEEPDADALLLAVVLGEFAAEVELLVLELELEPQPARAMRASGRARRRGRVMRGSVPV